MTSLIIIEIFSRNSEKLMKTSTGFAREDTINGNVTRKMDKKIYYNIIA